MATKRQIAANRRNALKSTGPTSPEGKAASSMNALKSGIDAESEVLPCENRADLEELTARYYHRFQPTTPELSCFVDEVVYCEWTLRRLRRGDTELHLFVHEECFEKNEDLPLGQAYETNPRAFSRLQWRMDATRRALRNALDSLRELSSNPIPGAVCESASEPVPAIETNQTASIGIGFVPAPPAESPKTTAPLPVPKAPAPEAPAPEAPTPGGPTPVTALISIDRGRAPAPTAEPRPLAPPHAI